jgi:hypothetical protein
MGACSEAAVRRALAPASRRALGVGLFGGAIVPETLHFPLSHIPAGDLRGWVAIEAWTARLPEALGVGALAA